MGGAQSDIIVKLLEENADLERLLAKFDASKSRCFLNRDRQNLLAVIEAGFGTFTPFNKLVRQVFANKLATGDASPSSEGQPLAEAGGASERAPRGKASTRIAPE